LGYQGSVNKRCAEVGAVRGPPTHLRGFAGPSMK
jgi:hypothetical protein